jgi:hypothetical protein
MGGSQHVGKRIVLLLVWDEFRRRRMIFQLLRTIHILQSTRLIGVLLYLMINEYLSVHNIPCRRVMCLNQRISEPYLVTQLRFRRSSDADSSKGSIQYFTDGEPGKIETKR